MTEPGETVREKLERALIQIRHVKMFGGPNLSGGLGARLEVGEREISEALALLESEQGEQMRSAWMSGYETAHGYGKADTTLGGSLAARYVSEEPGE